MGKLMDRDVVSVMLGENKTVRPSYWSTNNANWDEKSVEIDLHG